MGVNAPTMGALEDGTSVDYISSDDGANGGLVLAKKDSKEPMRWLGSMATGDDGTITITDDTSKESISFKLSDATEGNAKVIEVEGYGKGVLVPMTASDWMELGKELKSEQAK